MAFFENAWRFGGDAPDEKEIVAATLRLSRDARLPRWPLLLPTVQSGSRPNPRWVRQTHPV
jgi:hypothetical protein